MAAAGRTGADRLGRLLSAAQDPRYQEPHRRKGWRLWCSFARSLGQDPFLTSLQDPASHLERRHMFLAFAVALRQGELEGGRQAAGKKIEEILQYCGATMVSKGFLDPRRRDPSQHRLDQPITSYLTRCKRLDPAPKPQQALPASTIHLIAEAYCDADDGGHQTTGCLIVLAYFFLLRVGEYTPSPGQRLTVPLRKRDLKLWRGHQVIPTDAPVEELLQADSVRINIENQKNGKKGATLYHTSTNDVACPVQAAARLLRQLRGMPPDTPLGTYRTADGTHARITAKTIRTTLRHTATYQNLANAGYDYDHIGSHSLRSGGAMALKLAGYDDDTIKKLGRWSSDTYLTYIQTQIGNLTAGVASAMATRLDLRVVN